MIQLKQIYFDGKSYSKHLLKSNEASSQVEIDIANRLDFSPVDSIFFEQYPPQTYCDITIGDYFFQAVSLKYLFTDIQKQTRTILYPSHNPSPQTDESY